MIFELLQPGCDAHLCPCCATRVMHALPNRYAACDHPYDWTCYPCRESVVNERCVLCYGEEES
jgi:hypothetical protein